MNALQPFLKKDIKGRNNFEGHKTNRIYALLNKSEIFGNMVTCPLVMQFVRDELGESALLSALLAIHLMPGETVQPWHTFAVRRYLQTRDIYRVKQELGHQSVTTTEIYAKFSLRRLEVDFPTLVNNDKNGQISEKVHGFKVHTPSNVPVDSTIQGVS